MKASVIRIREARPRQYHLIKRFCQCLGLAAILLATNYGDLLGGGADVRMHVPFALRGIVVAQLADIFILAAFFFAILAPLSRTRLYPVLRLLLVILVPPYVLFRLQEQLPYMSINGVLTVIFIVWGTFSLVCYLRVQNVYRRLIRIGDAAGVFLFVFAACSILQLFFVMLWKPGPYQHIAAWAKTSQPATPREHPRLVWIVFDELSFDQTFGHRSRELSLPNFDALRNQSTLFTNTQTIGTRTVKIIPSLLSGNVVDDTRFGFNNSFKVHYVGKHGWHPLDGSGTLFADAQKQGWRTAAVGWYNPYCTIYAGAIDDCYAMNLDRIDGDMAQRHSVWSNIYSPLAGMVREVKAPARSDRDSCTYDVRQRLQTFLDLRQHAMQELQNDQADLTFLHMPVPHSPNIWNRNTDNFTSFCDSSYLDNLALADRTLGEMMKQLQASPRWKDTTVIVQGDHSWRMYLWNNQPTWTEEDDAITRSGFDPRPALLIHRAGQTAPETDNSKWLLVKVHDVVEQVLHGGSASQNVSQPTTP
jgi:hypothetical protein